MKIGVVSDTHSHVFPQQMVDDFKNVDMIIHVGDFCSREDLEMLRGINKVRAVFGNMDGLEIRQILPERDIFEVDGVRIGLYHGQGSPQSVLSYVKKEFKKDKPDVVIFGHSHQPFNEKINGTLYFNPGSPFDIVRAPFCSYGIIDIRNGEVKAEIVRIED